MAQVDPLAGHENRPGGSLDALAQSEYHERATDPGHDQAAAAPGWVVPTAEVRPPETIPRMVTLSAANPFLRILPRDQARRRAMILPVDNDVLFTESEDQARQLAGAVAGGAAAASLTIGAYWTKGVALPLESCDQVFVVATTQSGASRVSVIVERYAQPAG